MDELAGNAAAGEPMVVEACEYDRSFLQFRPAAALITNVEREHVDCFPTERLLHDAFRAFVEHIRPGGLLVVPEGLSDLLASTRRCDLRIVTFSGPGGGADWRPVRIVARAADSEVEIEARNGTRLRVRWRMAGRHNVTNLTGVLALAGEWYGPDACAAAAEELGEFRGLRRRFEILRSCGPVLVDDYAHHPSEVAAVIAAARERFPAARRLVVVLQPHQRQRLEALEDGFIRALSGADRVVVTPVFAAREQGAENGAASASFTDRLVRAGSAATFCPDFENAREALLGDLSRADVVLFLGAGDITDFAGDVARSVAGTEARTEDVHG
jgi:UDP-N-acetylmuramate--alanine ligase